MAADAGPSGSAQVQYLEELEVRGVRGAKTTRLPLPALVPTRNGRGAQRGPQRGLGRLPCAEL